MVYKKDQRLALYLHTFQYGSTFLLEDSAGVLNSLGSSSPDVTHPDGHPCYTCQTRLVVLLELHGEGEMVECERNRGRKLKIQVKYQIFHHQLP